MNGCVSKEEKEDRGSVDGCREGVWVSGSANEEDSVDAWLQE